MNIVNTTDDLKRILLQTKYGNGDSDKHALTLFSLVLSLNAKNILELGVRNGGTTLPLLCGAAETGGKVTSVDIQPTDFKCPEYLKSMWTFECKNALDYLRNLPAGERFDLIYLDDWHAYEHVKAELAILDKHVSPSSLICVHDLMYANYEPHYHSDIACRTGQWANGGPYRAVAELSDNFWEFATIPINNGLTILRKK
jgi:predicted O-methyltransferase YrrM